MIPKYDNIPKLYLSDTQNITYTQNIPKNIQYT